MDAMDAVKYSLGETTSHEEDCFVLEEPLLELFDKKNQAANTAIEALLNAKKAKESFFKAVIIELKSRGIDYDSDKYLGVMINTENNMVQVQARNS